MPIISKITDLSDEYKQEVEIFVSYIAAGLIDKNIQDFPYLTITVGENWLHAASVTYDETKKPEISTENLNVICVSTKYARITNDQNTLENMLNYINFFEYDNFAIIPLTSSIYNKVKKLFPPTGQKEDEAGKQESLEEKVIVDSRISDYITSYKGRKLNVIPKINSRFSSSAFERGVRIFVDSRKLPKSVN